MKNFMWITGAVFGVVLFGTSLVFAEDQKMHSKQALVATSDGGVVIFIDGKLAKYDATMNLVKEVEIKKELEIKTESAPTQNSTIDENQALLPVTEIVSTTSQEPLAPETPSASGAEGESVQS